MTDFLSIQCCVTLHTVITAPVFLKHLPSNFEVSDGLVLGKMIIFRNLCSITFNIGIHDWRFSCCWFGNLLDLGDWGFLRRIDMLSGRPNSISDQRSDSPHCSGPNRETKATIWNDHDVLIRPAGHPNPSANFPLRFQRLLAVGLSPPLGLHMHLFTESDNFLNTFFPNSATACPTTATAHLIPVQHHGRIVSNPSEYRPISLCSPSLLHNLNVGSYARSCSRIVQCGL